MAELRIQEAALVFPSFLLGFSKSLAAALYVYEVDVKGEILPLT